jgi:bifunctional UDP-N-acetylglucosamine pyrophosphorylase/glucosamine-1-phosphate N-acetyltransferase
MRDTKAVILAAGKGTRMKSELPKVLHTVEGKPMVQHTIERARRAGVGEIIIVVGYKRELVMEALKDWDVNFAIQEEQRGTGHAVAQARPYLEGFDGNVVVLYGDMPLLSEETIRSLIQRRDETGAAGVILTIVLDNPPDFGRIVRDETGRVVRVVEVKDATPEQLAIKEVNVGAYCFDCQALLPALGQLRDDNAQGEFYLTDVVEILARDGHRVETVVTPNLEEALGINDPVHLAFAEKLSDIRYAESLYELIDATLAMSRARSVDERSESS